jgi:hypothetical protein
VQSRTDFLASEQSQSSQVLGTLGWERNLSSVHIGYGVLYSKMDALSKEFFSIAAEALEKEDHEFALKICRFFALSSHPTSTINHVQQKIVLRKDQF